MVKFGPPSPKANTLDIDEELTYANTFIDTWQIIKFLLEETKPVSTAELDSEDRECHICAADLTSDANSLHRAVRLPCNHIFGESCIKEWLSPFVPFLPDVKELSLGANTCPMCRQVFFPEQSTVDLLPEIEARIMVWDKAYAHVGISLSEQQVRAREDLLRYLNTYSNRGLDVCYPDPTALAPYLQWARGQLLSFSLLLQFHELTPVQKHLRQSLENFAKPDFLGGPRWFQNDQDGLYFRFDHDRDGVQDSKSDESDQEVEAEAEEESEELAEGDTEEMKFFRILLRWRYMPWEPEQPLWAFSQSPRRDTPTEQE